MLDMTFKFVTVSHPDQIKNRKNQESIRQHAIRSGIQRSYAERPKRRELFVPFIAKEKRQKQSSVVLPKTPSIGLLDPFDTLCACPERLRNLLRHPSAKQAGEPVFCVEDSGKLLFQGMDSILKGALTDPVLFHALSLVLTLAANANVPNVEILAHRGELLDRMQIAMLEPGWKPKVSSITAMLILIGYEYRTEGGDCDSISIHIRGVQAMMDKYKAENVAVVGQIRRALFWQDLLGCFVIGTTRLLSHELHREWLYPHCTETQSRYATPDEFFGMFGDWPPAFAAIFQDLAMLCKIIDECSITGETFPIDDSQANLESRLVDLLSTSRLSHSPADPIYEACIYAAYLCTYKLSVGIWNGCFIPEICVDRILSHLADAAHDPRWAISPSLLLWLLFVVGGLTEQSSSRQRAIVMIEHVFVKHLEMLHQEWDVVKTFMKAFIWSESAIERKVFRSWQKLHSDTITLLRWHETSSRLHCAA